MRRYLAVEKKQGIKFRITEAHFVGVGIKTVIIGSGLQPVSVDGVQIAIYFHLGGHLLQGSAIKPVIRIGIYYVLSVRDSNSTIPGTINSLSFRGANIHNVFKPPHKLLGVLPLILWGTRINDNNFKLVLQVQGLIGQILKTIGNISFRIIS